jgi:hypothetical protein
MSVLNLYPTVRPTLSFDFVNAGVLDPSVTFTRPTNATYFDETGILRVANPNTPRFDYNPSTLVAQGLLIEESRANLWSYSDDFGNAAWTKGGATVSTDTTTAPTGTTIADSLIENTSTGQHRVSRSVSGTTNTNPYTTSVFVKANTRTRVYIGIAEGTTFVRQGNAVFDLSAGIIVSAVSGTGGATGGSATITAVGNGWYRCTYTLTLGGTDTNIFNDIALVSTGTTISYTGDGTSGLFLFGAQLEAGAFPTSYIPTTTTTLTRSADVASVNTLSPWYNATEGTAYAEVALIGLSATANQNALQFSDGTSSNRIALYRQSAALSTALSFGATINGSSWTTTAIRKIALGNKSGDSALADSGAIAGTGVGTTVQNVNQLRLGSNHDGTGGFTNGYLRRITYYPLRLSNAQLQNLTA